MKSKFAITALLLLASLSIAHAVTICTGTGDTVAIDLTQGERPAALSETIRYSTAWETDAAGAVAVVAVNGEEISSAAGSGAVEWQPIRNGTYTLTHRVLVGGEQVGETLTAVFEMTLAPDAPVIAPAGGAVGAWPVTITMSCATEGAAIHYTTDGSEPTEASPAYGGPGTLTLSRRTVVKAIAVREGLLSDVSVAEYVLGQCATPVVTAPATFVDPPAQVALSCATPGATIRYTLDGSAPNSHSRRYSGPFEVTGSCTVKAYATCADYLDSEVASFAIERVCAIRDVTAQQRYPWNGKVDITYTLDVDAEAVAGEGRIAWLKVTATDGETGQAYTAASLEGDTSLAAGTHHLVWDMGADGLAFESTNVIFTVSCEAGPPTYCVIDLSAGANAAAYPVTYIGEAPPGGFNADEYKTTKLVLKRIEAGTFIMGDNQSEESHRVTLTKPFYMGLFEVTQKQWSLVMGNNPSDFKGDTRPVERVSYNAIRGSSSDAQWPASNAVDSSSFLGKLRARTGLDFDLPTEAQWEYACRAGTTTTYSYGNFANGNYMWYNSNSSSQTHEVGTKQPNPWGLYDMHGNVYEWCLDWYNSSLAYGTDPKGSSSGSSRVIRGGSWGNDAYICTSSSRGSITPSFTNYGLGFRLVRTLSE